MWRLAVVAAVVRYSRDASLFAADAHHTRKHTPLTIVLFRANSSAWAMS